MTEPGASFWAMHGLMRSIRIARRKARRSPRKWKIVLTSARSSPRITRTISAQSSRKKGEAHVQGHGPLPPHRREDGAILSIVLVLAAVLLIFAGRHLWLADRLHQERRAEILECLRPK